MELDKDAPPSRVVRVSGQWLLGIEDRWALREGVFVSTQLQFLRNKLLKVDSNELVSLIMQIGRLISEALCRDKSDPCFF